MSRGLVMFLAVFLAVVLVVLAACEPSGPRVVAYVSLDSIYSGSILDRYSRASGVRMIPRFDAEFDKTTGLMNRILAMRQDPEADLFWNNEVMRSIVLKRKGCLARYVPPTAADIPAAFKDPDGYWTGFAARARVILVNTDLVAAAAEPTSIFDFLKPEWKRRFAVARPLFGTSSTHAAAMFAVLGPAKAKALMQGWLANGCRVQPGNAQCRNLVRDGHIAACLTDTDDANGAIAAGAPVRMIYPDQGEGQLGTLVIPNTVVLIRNGPNPEQAKRLIDHICSREVEAWLARSAGAQMPLRAGIRPHSRQFDFTRIKAMAVDWERVADQLEAANAFVQEAFEK